MNKIEDMTPEELADFNASRAGFAATKQRRAALQAIRDARLADVPPTATIAQLRAIVQGLIEDRRGD